MRYERCLDSYVNDVLNHDRLGSGTYVNVMPEPDVSDVQDVYGAKFTRLQAVKANYDPGNVFHRNANIPPAVSPATDVPPGSDVHAHAGAPKSP